MFTALLILLLSLLSTPVEATFVPRGIGSVGTVQGALDVYPGCTPAPANLNAPVATSKTWYVSGTNVSPAGDTPANGANGTAAHPYNSITALFYARSWATSNTNTWTGWTTNTPAAVFGLGHGSPYNIPAVPNAAYASVDITPTTGSVTINVGAFVVSNRGILYSIENHAAFTSLTTVHIAAMQPGAYTTPQSTDTFTFSPGAITGSYTVSAPYAITAGIDYETYDSGHAMIWPGDVIIVNGTNPIWSASAVSTSPYQPNELTFNMFGSALRSVGDESSAQGKTVWTVIQPGPSAPLFDTVATANVQGIIIDNFVAGAQQNLYLTSHMAGTFLMGPTYLTGPPTTSSQYLLGPFGSVATWNFVNTHTTANQIVINGSLTDSLFNTYSEFLHDATTQSLVVVQAPASPTAKNESYGFTWVAGSATGTVNIANDIIWPAAVPTINPNSTFVANGVTYTLVTGTPGANQIQIGATLDATMSNIVTALAAASPSVTATPVISTAYGFSWTVSGVSTNVDLFNAFTWDSTNHVVTITPNYTFVADSITWTLVTGTPGTHQIQIASSLAGTLSNISTALIANDAGLTFSANEAQYFNMQAVAVGLAGAIENRLINVTTVFSVDKVAATVPVFTVSGTSGTSGVAKLASVVGTPIVESHDLILANLNLGGTNYGETFAGPTSNANLPVTGSLGVDPITSAQGSGLTWYINSPSSIPVSIPTTADCAPTICNGDTFTIDGILYTWKTTPTVPCTGGPCDIQINATSLIQSLLNAVTAVNNNDAAAYVSEYAVNGPWNLYDVTTLEPTGILATGGYTNGLKKPDPDVHNVDGLYCFSAQNIYYHHAMTANMTMVHDSMFENIQSYYSAQDAFDLGPGYNIIYKGAKTAASLYNLSGTHSDGFQTQSGISPLNIFVTSPSQIATLGEDNLEWDDNEMIENGVPALFGKSQQVLDKLGLIENLANTGQSCWQGTWPIQNSFVRNNLCYVEGGGIHFTSGTINTLFANNTLLNAGIDPTDLGFAAGVNTAAEIVQAHQPLPTGNIYVNNLTNGLGIGFGLNNPSSGVCTGVGSQGVIGSVFRANITVPPVYDGTVQGSLYNFGQLCLANGTTYTQATYIPTSCTDQFTGLPKDGQLIVGVMPASGCGITVGALDSTASYNSSFSATISGTTLTLTSTTTPSWGGIMPGASVSGTGVAAGTHIVGLQYGSGYNVGDRFTIDTSQTVSTATAMTTTLSGLSNPIMTAYHPQYQLGRYDPTQLNPAPPGYPSAPTGGLVCSGVNVPGVLTTNHDGLPWAGGSGCIGIGAY